MAIKTVNDGYIPGDYWMECDRCGLSYRRSDLMRDGFKKGLMVCRPCWDFKPTYPSPPPDRIAVPIPRPANDSVTANSVVYEYIGPEMFPDPFMLQANSALWSSGTLTQQHVVKSFYSRKLTGETTTITVSGLTPLLMYRIRISAWSTQSAQVLIDSVDTGLFSSLTTKIWNTETIYWQATSNSVVFSLIGSANGTYYDDIHVQEYEAERKKPSADIINNASYTKRDYTEEGTIINFFSFSDHPDSNSTSYGTDSESGGIYIK